MRDDRGVRQAVLSRLATLERECNVRVLYACESGSRAWGFASQDSDYDVRFLYVHPRDWYLSVRENRDVINGGVSDNLDLAGWDLRKALRLLGKGNPSLFEWLNSPMIYRCDYRFLAEFRQLAGAFYQEERCFYHYLRMARQHWATYLEGRERVAAKKYLYVFRSLLACRWIERGLGPVPVEFSELVGHVLDEQEVRVELDRLIAQKRDEMELQERSAVPVFTGFVSAELERLSGGCKPDGESGEGSGDGGMLDRFLRRQLTFA